MAALVVSALKVLGIREIDPFHNVCETSSICCGLKHQVHVIGHEHIVEELEAELLFVFSEYRHVSLVVVIALKDVLPVVPSTKHMVDVLVGRYSCCSRHLSCSASSSVGAEKRTVPFFSLQLNAPINKKNPKGIV